MTPNESEFAQWLIDPHTTTLSDHYKAVAKRYAFWYSYKHDLPIGRPLAHFMMWFNKNHSNMKWFPREMINYWYYY